MRGLTFLAIGIMVTAFSGCMGLGASEKVSATDNQFTPNSLTLKQNGVTEWKNDGSNRHSITIHKVGDPVTQTKKDTDITAGTNTDHKFQETGTYHVYCKYHSSGAAGQFSNGMVMTITVE